MKILLISDSHMLGGIDELITIEQPNLTLHMGDSQLMHHNDEMSRIDYAVRGNCDYDHYPQKMQVEIAGKSWLLTHGDRIYNPHDLEQLATYAQESGAQVLCYGHTHVPVYAKVNGVMILNPGSLARSRANCPNSYMTVEIDNGVWTVTLKQAKNSEIIEVMECDER